MKRVERNLPRLEPNWHRYARDMHVGYLPPYLVNNNNNNKWVDVMVARYLSEMYRGGPEPFPSLFPSFQVFISVPMLAKTDIFFAWGMDPKIWTTLNA